MLKPIQALDGQKSFFIKIFNYMTLGLLATAGVAFGVSHSPAMLNFLFGSTLMSWIVMLAPLAFVIYLSFRIQSMSPEKARFVFFLYSGVMGLSLATIFLVYPIANIVHAFLISSATFGAMSLYGYTTKRDLTAMGSFMFMGLIGVILAGFVNYFVGSSMMAFIVDVITVIVFVGLTAYDIQKMKYIYATTAGQRDGIERAAVQGALNLYLDFINLFLTILRLMGGRRD